MLRREDVGHRIVVRRLAGSRDGRPVYSDALGELTELTDTHLTVETVRGPVEVPLGEVHRAKLVPPPRRAAGRQIAALELAADAAWPAPVRERLGDWWLRAADGWTGRANSALPVGDPGRPLGQAVDAVERWYAERALPARMNVPLPLAAPVGALLDERGWRSGPLVVVQTVRLPDLLDAAAERADLAPVGLSRTPTPDWLDVITARKGRGSSALPGAALHVLTAVDEVRFAHVYADGNLLAVARGTVTGQGRWLGLSLIEVAPAARRAGLARHVMGALAHWAGGIGATDAYLQVEQDNKPALAL
ncbi:MAG TPA: GNAT family N-acetyltransferase, partial [Micromonosporaceae bacterium]|nr:GNAT family N-acetyltransferase [Micromonosporaceae bacterium]